MADRLEKVWILVIINIRMLEYLRTPSLRLFSSTRMHGYVLLIDNNPLVVRFLTIKLENAGYRVSLASDINDAIKRALELKNVDIIALAASVLEDCPQEMPSLHRALTCPVMVYGMSSYFSPEEQRRSGITRYFDCFSKPDDFLKALELTRSSKTE